MQKRLKNEWKFCLKCNKKLNDVKKIADHDQNQLSILQKKCLVFSISFEENPEPI